MKRQLAIVAAVLSIGAGTALASGMIGGAAPSGPRVPVLAELFTSEGCSSCPPADDLLRHLVRDQPVAGVEVIAISEHVDYWNRLGWKDPFSSAQFSERQGEYARAFGGEQIYTPQLVVDGRVQVIGNDHTAVTKALLSAVKATRATLEVAATRAAGGRASVQVTVTGVPAENATHPLEVMVAVVEDGLVTDVPRGENARKRLQHDAVARVLRPMGSLLAGRTSGSFSQVVDLGHAGSNGVRVIAFLQDRSSRSVVGVATTPLVDAQGTAGDAK